MQPKQASSNYKETYPSFVIETMQACRAVAEKDSIIRIRADSSAKTVVAFTAKWQDRAIKDIERRVYLATKATDDGMYQLVFMKKVFDDNAVTKEYDHANRGQMSKDIMRYLRIGHLDQ